MNDRHENTGCDADELFHVAFQNDKQEYLDFAFRTVHIAKSSLDLEPQCRV